MDSKIPNLLYPQAFLTPWMAADITRDYQNIVQDDYDKLIEATKSLYYNPSQYRDFQRVIFNSKYDARLQPFGFEEVPKNLGIDLYNQILSTPDTTTNTYRIYDITDERGQPIAHSIIQSMNASGSIDASSLNVPIIYVSSPYTIVKAVSNLADKGDRRKIRGHFPYMISTEGEGYASVISGQIPGREKKSPQNIFTRHPMQRDCQ